MPRRNRKWFAGVSIIAFGTASAHAAGDASTKQHATAQPAAAAAAYAPTDADEPYSGPPVLWPGPLKVGGYFGPSLAYSRLTPHHGGLLLGAEASLLLEHRLAVGVAGYAWGNETHGPAAPDGSAQNLELLYAGIVARYAPFTRWLVYPSGGLLLGAGAVSLVPNQGEVPRSNVDTFFVIEPQVAAHTNITRWVRLTLQLGYRFTAGVSRFGYTESDYDGFTLGIGVQFGWL